MFKIGEFSKLTQVSIRMLRYYDETGLLKPAMIDKSTGYRLYSSSQIPDLNKILFLRDLGFSVTKMQGTFINWNSQSITELLTKREQQIETEIAAQQHKLLKIAQAKKDILQQNLKLHYNVSIKSIPSCPVFSLRKIVPDYYAEGLLWKELSAYAQKHQLSLSDNTFTIYHDEDYREQNVDIEICCPILAEPALTNHNGFTYRITEAVPLMASTMVYGHLENIAAAYHAFADWLQHHQQYQMDKHSRQIVHRGPWNETDSNNYLTEIQIPLKTR